MRAHQANRKPSAPASTFADVFVRELEDGQAVEQVLLVREAQRRSTRSGDDYLRLVLADRTGTLVAVLWDCSEEAFGLAAVGVPVHVTGRYGIHERYGPQLKLSALRPAAPAEYDLAELVDGPSHDVEQMERDLRELVGTIQTPHLRALLDSLIGPESELWPILRDAPAAKYYHQAYRHGLLEHILGVAQAVHGVSATFPDVDHDVAVTGALLHDIGKLEAYAFVGAAIEMSDAGKLQGEIPLGYYRVRRAVEALPGFPPALAEAILHIILSHHGALEHGSPVVPCTREATLVHMIDNLGGRLGSFDRLEKELPAGARWSGYDRALDSSAYFADRAAAAREAA
jgi:3'-5' exoribonuclease